MNEDLAWHFDLAVIEWLIILVMLVLSVVGAVVTRRRYRAVKDEACQSGQPGDDSSPWHMLDNARVFTLLDAGPDGLAKEQLNLRLGEY